MLTSELEHGLPTDLGIRPQLNVLVDLKTFIDQQSSETVMPPVELTGFGPIGPNCCPTSSAMPASPASWPTAKRADPTRNSTSSTSDAPAGWQYLGNAKSS